MIRNVSLTSDVPGNVAYHGERVKLLCIIVADRNILVTWRSPQYIGVDILQLLSTYRDGYTVRSRQNPATVATLINTTRSNGIVTVTTELQLTASAVHRISRASCRANGGRWHTVTFFTSRLPGNAHWLFFCILIILFSLLRIILTLVTTTTMMVSQSDDVNDVIISSTAESTLNLSEITKGIMLL